MRLSLRQEYISASNVKTSVSREMRNLKSNKISIYKTAKAHMPSSDFALFENRATMSEARTYVRIYKTKGLALAYEYLRTII